MRIGYSRGGRGTVAKNCSVKTPRIVGAVSTTRTLCEASAERLRLKWHGCEARGQCTVSVSIVNEFTEVRIRRSESQTHVVCGFSVQLIYRWTRAAVSCKKTLRRNLAQKSFIATHHDACLMRFN